MVCLEFLDILEDLDQRDLLDSQDSLDQTAKKEQGVLAAKLDPGDKEDQRAPEGSEGRGAPQENQEQRGLQEVTVLLVLLERGDCPGPREPMVSPDQKDPLAPQERTDCLDTLDREEKLVSKVKWVHLDHLESWDLRVHLERPAPWVSVATPDPLVHLESRDYLVPQGKKVLKETLDLLEDLVRTDHQV